MYPGVEDVLRRIHDSDIPLSLATSKPEYPAKLILEHFHLLRYFDVITGASEDEVRSAKADVVAEALERLAAFGAELFTTRHGRRPSPRCSGCRRARRPFDLRALGYGSPAEEVGTIGVATMVLELTALLLGP